MSTNPILKVISENESLLQQLQGARQEVEHFSKQNLEWAKCAASWQERAEKAEASNSEYAAQQVRMVGELASLKAVGEGWIQCSQWAGVAGESVQVMAEGYDMPLTAIYFEKDLFNSVPGMIRLRVSFVRPLPPSPAKPAEGPAAKEEP